MRKTALMIFASIVAICCAHKLSAQKLPEAEITVLFETGRHKISRQMDSILGAFLFKIEPDEIKSIEIVAHTDAIGDLRFNELLSERRANSVSSWLSDYGIDTSLCILSWKGEIDSLVANASEELRQINRRARIRVYLQPTMSPVTGSVLDSVGMGINAQIILRGMEFIDSTRTDSTGYFSLPAPDTTVLGIDVFAKGYVYTSRMFKNDRRRKLDLTFKPTPIQRGVKFQLHRFYFVGDQAVLLKSSEQELIRLMRFMTLNPTTIIAIEGHINLPNSPAVSRESTHFNLSERRAKMVCDYLLEQDILPKRMYYAGFGNCQMGYPKTLTEKEQQKNRRVEIRIVAQ